MKSNILNAPYALGRELQARGADVQLVRIPDAGGVKVGLDDLILREGVGWSDFFNRLERLPLTSKEFKPQGHWYTEWKRKQELQPAKTGTYKLTRKALEKLVKLKQGEFIKALADLISHMRRFAKNGGGELYVFTGATYEPLGKDYISADIKIILAQLHGDRWSSHLVNEVTAYIATDVPLLWEKPPLHTVNVRNGLLDIDALSLRPHTPDFLSCVQLNVTYDPAATCPEWERCLTRVLDPEHHQTIFEIIAWLMRPDLSIQKAILLFGDGENGKSGLLTAIVNFLGQKNVSSLSLQKLEMDKFSIARLVGKLANVCADLPSEDLQSSSIFKALVGGDLLLGEKKFGTSFEFRPYARLLFSANFYPKSRDASHAFFRRWHVLHFTRVLEGSDRLKPDDLAALLAQPQELSGVLNKALSALPALKARGTFSENEATTVALYEFRRATDPISAWLDMATVMAADAMVTKKDLLITYNAHAQERGLPMANKTGFGLAIKRLRPTIEEGNRTLGSVRQWVWVGLGLRESVRCERGVQTIPQINIINGNYKNLNRENSEHFKHQGQEEVIDL